MNLTDPQIDAIQHYPGNLQLIACAGSGKTEVVARHVVYLLSCNLLPRNIIAFTFTDKAASELKERITSRCQEEFGEIHGMAEMYIGTIHAFCLDLLKNEVPKYLKYDVLNEVQQFLFIDRNSRGSGLTTTNDLHGNPLRRYVDTKHYLNAISILRETEYDKNTLNNYSILDGLNKYSQLLDKRRFFDYSSIMEGAVDVLTNEPEIRKRIADRVKYVIVDEYQDLNPIQETIIRLLNTLGAEICVVGDDDQTIYQWRGSEIQNILTFETRYQSVTQRKLEENFRSSEGIVKTAQEFIEQNTERLPKQMINTNEQPYDPGDIVALSFYDPEQEANYIATTIKSLLGVAIKDNDTERGIAWSDMAILLRSVSSNGQPIMDALNSANIPYVIIGMNNLFESREANAARFLFYFMAHRENVDENALEESWLNSDLGLNRENLKAAILMALQFREQFDNPTERFSFYSIQRVFQRFLEIAGVCEEKIPDNRGEIVFYNLGKFSQIISDFEAIYYHSKPKKKYESFADFLRYRADEAYPEGIQDNQYITPNAVQIMTIHQAKGLQWPVVFIPALIKNRFPSKKQGGRTVWHIIPREGIPRQERFEGTIEDERRLFYVAMTRSKKFLHMTWAPIFGKRLYQKASDFWENVLASKYVKRQQSDYSTRKRLHPEPRKEVSNVVFSFSDLKYYFECPYQFKLRVLYGFNAPLHEALGYGRSLHNILAEIHSRAIHGDYVQEGEVETLVERHLHTPYAYSALRKNLEVVSKKVISNYIYDNKDLFDKIEFSEKTIEIRLDDGISVVGRIDLVRHIDTGKTSIVDLKSSDRAQSENITENQLHIYALGYQELTGQNADYVEIYELDERKRKSRSVDNDFIINVKHEVAKAAISLRESNLSPLPHVMKCSKCDHLALCGAGGKALNQNNKH